MNKYFYNIWLGFYTVLVGLGITLRHLFGRKVTKQYPEKIPNSESLAKEGLLPANSRNRIFVDMDDCNGCNGCVRACPVNCITVDTIKVVPGDEIPPLKSGGKRGLWVSKYQIDFALCCFCSLCTEACPTHAIVMTPEFEYSAYNRKDLIYTFAEMPEDEVKDKNARFAKFQAEKKKKAAAAKKANAAVMAKSAPKEAKDAKNEDK